VRVFLRFSSFLGGRHPVWTCFSALFSSGALFCTTVSFYDNFSPNRLSFRRDARFSAPRTPRKIPDFHRVWPPGRVGEALLQRINSSPRTFLAVPIGMSLHCTTPFCSRLRCELPLNLELRFPTPPFPSKAISVEASLVYALQCLTPFCLPITSPCLRPITILLFPTPS